MLRNDHRGPRLNKYDQGFSPSILEIKTEGAVNCLDI